MKGNKKILVIAVLLLLISISFTTYAIYKTAVSGSATVDAAKWSVKFKDGSTELVENYEIELGSDDCKNNAHVADGVIAPGATCTKTITLDADDSQVDVAYTVSTGSVTATSGTANLSTGSANTFSASLSPSSGTITYSNNTRTTDLTLTVEWGGDDDSPTDTKNNADTDLAGATITVPITLVAKQVVEAGSP